MPKRKRKKRRAKRILGNDRGLMFICKDIRRRWLQYGENRKVYFAQEDRVLACSECGTVQDKLDIDHIKPLGARPRTWNDLGKYAEAMFERECQALCKSCHKRKTDEERKKRKG